MQRGSLTNELGPGCDAGGSLKNWVIGTAAVFGTPCVVHTFHAWFTPSSTNPLPTHSAWSCGSRPPFVPAYSSVPAFSISRMPTPLKPLVSDAAVTTLLPAGFRFTLT